MTRKNLESDIKNAFFDWLSKQVSPVQLSELDIAAAEIEEYCLNKKLLSNSVFDEIDGSVISQLREHLTRDRLFKFFNRGKTGRMLSVLKYYELYCSEKIKKSEMSSLQSQEPAVSKIGNSPEPIENGLLNNVEEPRTNSDDTKFDSVLAYASKNEIDCVDKRPQNGCLWLIGGMELDKNIAELKRMGYHFRYAPDGSKSTGRRPGWFMQTFPQADEMELASSESSSGKVISPELMALLEGDDYSLLRDCLLQQNILTREQFEKENPWVFMNRHGLYSIGQRQKLFKQIMVRLNPVKTAETAYQYTLQTQTSCYSGETPAMAFAAFCEEIAQKYPLKIRTILDMQYNGKGPVVLSRTPLSGNCAMIQNPSAYISETLTSQTAVIYGQWICKMCNEQDCPVSMLEPNGHDVPLQPEEKIQPIAVQLEMEIEKENSECPSATPNSVQLDTKLQGSTNTPMVEKAEGIVLSVDINGMSINDLCNQLGTTMVATKQVVASSARIVSISEKLIHQDSFVDWEDGADQIERILVKLLEKNNGYVSAAQLYEYVHAEMQMFLNDNDLDDPRAVYDLAQHLFEKVGYHGKRLIFWMKQHISEADTVITNNLDVMMKFAREQGGFFTEDDLEAYMKSVGLKTGNMRGQMQVYTKPYFLFYAEHAYMTGESIGFDDDWFETANKALDNLFADMGNHVVLRDIQPWWYTQLPPLPGDKEWTALLLQSVLMHYSPRLNGAHTICGLESQNGNTLHAMLVSGTSEVRTFADAVIAFLVDDEVEQRKFGAEELRQLLVRRGMVAGNELIWNMPKALAKDERFAWDADGLQVTVKV